MSISNPTPTLPAAGPNLIIHALVVIGALIVAGAVKLARVLRSNA